MRGRISPRLLTTFVVGMPQQTCCWIVQVLVVDKHLLGRFGVCVSAVAEHPTVANHKGKRHEHPINPKLPVAPDLHPLPETTAPRPRIVTDHSPNVFRAHPQLL